MNPYREPAPRAIYGISLGDYVRNIRLGGMMKVVRLCIGCDTVVVSCEYGCCLDSWLHKDTVKAEPGVTDPMVILPRIEHDEG